MTIRYGLNSLFLSAPRRFNGCSYRRVSAFIGGENKGKAEGRRMKVEGILESICIYLRRNRS